MWKLLWGIRDSYVRSSHRRHPLPSSSHNIRIFSVCAQATLHVTTAPLVPRHRRSSLPPLSGARSSCNVVVVITVASPLSSRSRRAVKFSKRSQNNATRDTRDEIRRDGECDEPAAFPLHRRAKQTINFAMKVTSPVLGVVRPPGAA